MPQHVDRCVAVDWLFKHAMCMCRYCYVWVVFCPSISKYRDIRQTSTRATRQDMVFLAVREGYPANKIRTILGKVVITQASASMQTKFAYCRRRCCGKAWLDLPRTRPTSLLETKQQACHVPALSEHADSCLTVPQEMVFWQASLSCPRSQPAY